MSQHLLWFAPVALEDAAEVEDVWAAAMPALANSAAPVNKPSLIIETSLRVTASVDNRTAITAGSYIGKSPSLGGLGLRVRHGAKRVSARASLDDFFGAYPAKACSALRVAAPGRKPGAVRPAFLFEGAAARSQP